jgi:hypothetical protein
MTAEHKINKEILIAVKCKIFMVVDYASFVIELFPLKNRRDILFFVAVTSDFHDQKE